MKNERTLTSFTEWINHSGKFQLNIYDKKGNLINIEEKERMKARSKCKRYVDKYNKKNMKPTKVEMSFERYQELENIECEYYKLVIPRPGRVS